MVDGIEYRSVTVVAYKGKQGPCREGNHAVIYPGPWSEVHDDDGHLYRRGERVAVCAKTYRLLTSEPYTSHIIGLPPYQPIAEGEQHDYPCEGYRVRHPRETKNGEIPVGDQVNGNACAPGGACC